MRIEENSIDSALFLSAPMDWGNVVGAMKPGAHLLFFNGVKTHHIGAIAAEDNGLEIRDTVAWVYDSGGQTPDMLLVTVARKPLEGIVAENTLKYGTGGLNIDGCRVQSQDNPMKWETPRGGIWVTDPDATGELVENSKGRWPANLIHDGSDEVGGLFPEAAAKRGQNSEGTSIYGSAVKTHGATTPNDTGSAARFFYTAPHLNDLLKYLLKLITPPGGTVLTNCDNILVQSAYPSVRYCEN
jgi:site-specific DNA-methyltransferase (adenine-specific)